MQNARLTYVSQLTGQPSAFDGTNRQGVRQDGNLNSYIAPGTCTTFSYKSNKNLLAQYRDGASCTRDFDPVNANPYSYIYGPQNSLCECKKKKCKKPQAHSLMHALFLSLPLSLRRGTWDWTFGQPG